MLINGRISPFVAFAPDDKAGAGGDAGAGQDPNAGVQDPNASNNGGTGQDSKTGSITDLEQAKSVIEELRKENAKHRKEGGTFKSELEKAQAKLKEIEDANLSESEKLKKQVQELLAKDAESNRRLVDSKILVAASKAGFADPQDAIALIDRSALGENEKDLEEAIKAVLKSKPYLAKATDGGGQGAGTNTGNPAGGAGAQLDQQKISRARLLFPSIAKRG